MAKSKKKQNGSDVLNIVFVLDETYSMNSTKSTTLSGFNEYITSLKNGDEKDAKFTLVLFNSRNIRTIYSDKLIKDVELLTDKTYNPDATTPLYDAIGQTIKSVEKRLSKDAKVLFVTMTDGLENSSSEFDRDSIFKLIKTKEVDDKWIFAFLGANQDSWETGSSIGLSKQASTMNYSQGNEAVMFGMLAKATRHANVDYKRSYNAGAFWPGEKEPDGTNES